MGILTYDNEQFYMDGKPYVILSGAIHYFRVPREYWRDRLLKLKECGFNTVETYTCWNLHERREGEFDFSGNLDIAEYVRIARDLGLNVILRPGPYICAEWEFGGFPAWLLTYRGMEIRCYDETFLSKVRNYYAQLLSRVRPYIAKNGGNIIMLQVENEYGSYGNDKKYLQAIADIYKENGMDCLYFTSDGPTYTMLNGGTLDGCLAVVNFGSKANAQLDFLKSVRRDQPVMCGEFWCGWFDHWFEKHHTREVEDVMNDFSQFLDRRASVNYYMFHGGTNFGFFNGANCSDKYEPTTTSYDYCAPLNEAGDRTPLYYAIREAVEKTFGSVPPLTATDSEKEGYGEIELTQSADLFENLERLSSPVDGVAPMYMEDLGQDFGFMLYRTQLKGPLDGWNLEITEVHDRAQIFANGKKVGTYERWKPNGQKENPVKFPLKTGEQTELDILVENMGRVNYGKKLWDHKGVKNVTLGLQHLFHWKHYPLPMDNLEKLNFKPLEDKDISSPTFLRGNLHISGAPKDTYVYLKDFKKGFVVVNGHNIGRYFNEAGPQKTLYLPAPYLNKGDNEIIVFESDGAKSNRIEFVGEMIW